METYEKYKVLMLKEEGDTSHVCQSYDQDAVKQDKASFSDDTSVLRSWIPATRGILNYLCLVKVSLQDTKKISREYCISSFKTVNVHPKYRVYFSQWYDRIKKCFQRGDYLKQVTKLNTNDEYDILSPF